MRLGSSCVWVVCLSVTLAAQNGGAPRDRPAETAASRITGRVSDDLGNPVPRVWVSAQSPAQDQPISTLTTPDGRFELAPLPPGRHLLIARKPGYSNPEWIEGTPGQGRYVHVVAGQALDRVEIVLRRGAVIVGRVVDEHGAPTPDVTVNVLKHVVRRGRPQLVAGERSATTDDRGEYRLWGVPEGVYVVAAESKAPAGPFAPTSGAGFAPTFAPSTSVLAEALRVQAAPGQEIVADIRLSLDRLVRVTGTVVASSGEAIDGGEIRLVTRGELRREGPMAMIMDGGRFSFPSVPPGAYLLVARAFARPAAAAPMAPEMALMPIDIGREDLTGLRVATTRGQVAAGIVSAQSGSLPTNAPVRIQFVATDPDLSPRGASLIPIDQAGRFTAPNLFGPVLLQPLLPRGWMPVSMRYDGEEVNERPFELRADGGPIQVIISDRLTLVSGAVTDDGGRPVTDCEIFIFAEDAVRWFSGARSVRKTRPDQNGGYRAEGLAPGRYHIVALRRIDENAMSDPAVLNGLRSLSVTVALVPGEPQRRDLRLTDTER